MMKKFFMPIFAALALTGCSDDVPGNGNEEPGISGGQFLAVDIISQGGGASRADANGTDVPGYEDGTSTENEVKGVRLYFFTATGDPVTIKKNATGNFYDIKTDPGVADPSQDHSQTVEKILKAVVIVDKGERLPAKVVAIVNPILEGAEGVKLGDKSYSFSALQERCLDYASYANGKATGSQQFIMSNSVYMDVNGLVNATTISSANYGSTPEAAKKNPIKIYVERTVAKVRLDASQLESITATDNETKLYKLLRKVENADGSSKDEYLTIAERESTSTIPDGGTDANGYQQSPVYLRLDGWDVTADASHAWLIKVIKTNWPRNYLGQDLSWNSADFHRSFWADECNPSSESNASQYYAYNDNTHFKQTLFDGKESTYCNENADRSGNILGLTNPKVLIKGTICDEAGNPLMISEYGGNRFIDDSSLSGLKNRYVEMLKGSRSELPWCALGDGTYRQLAPADLDMKAIEYLDPALFPKKEASADAATKTYDYEKGRYRVYPCLSAEAATMPWYVSVRYAEGGTTLEPGPAETVANINKYLLDLSYAQVWNGGKTYYYINIRHLGDNANGNWGTVRNHIYDIDITKIYGIGTPVYDETLTIEPEQPVNDNTYVAAQVRILQWRVVPQGVVLDWN